MLAISKLKITQEIDCIHFKISAKTCLVLLRLWMHGSMAQALPSRAVRLSERHHRNSQVFFYSFHSQISQCLMLRNDKTTPHIYKRLKWFSSKVGNSKHLRTSPHTNTQHIQQGYPICKEIHPKSILPSPCFSIIKTTLYYQQMPPRWLLAPANASGALCYLAYIP